MSTPADDAGEVAECASCGEGMRRNECSKSQRPCGHHCNHSWTDDSCHWCGVEFGEGGAESWFAGERLAESSPNGRPTIAEAEAEIAALEADKEFMASVLATRKAALVEARRERDEARAEADRLRAEVERLRTRRGDCICDYNPSTTDGPSEDCPQHGRPYSYWVERSDAKEAAFTKANAEADRLRATLAAVAEVVDNEDALRDHLDDLNQNGHDYRAVGIDAHGGRFMACLAGAYADTIVIVRGNPWDSEVEYGYGYHCDECNAHENGDVSDLSFPVTVLLSADPVSLADVRDTCRHGEPEGQCSTCAACSACRGECGICPYEAVTDRG